MRTYKVYHDNVFLEQITIDTENWNMQVSDTQLRLRLLELYQTYTSYFYTGVSSVSEYNNLDLLVFSASPSIAKFLRILSDLGLYLYSFVEVN